MVDVNDSAPLLAPAPVQPPSIASGGLSYSAALRSRPTSHVGAATRSASPPESRQTAQPGDSEALQSGSEAASAASPVVSTGVADLDAIFDEVVAKMKAEKWVPPDSYDDVAAFEVVSVEVHQCWSIEMDVPPDDAATSTEAHDAVKGEASRAELLRIANALSKKELKERIVELAPQDWLSGADINPRKRRKESLVSLFVAVRENDRAAFEAHMSGTIGVEDFMVQDSRTRKMSSTAVAQSHQSVQPSEDGWIETKRGARPRAEDVQAAIERNRLAQTEVDRPTKTLDTSESEQDGIQDELRKKLSRKSRRRKKNSMENVPVIEPSVQVVKSVMPKPKQAHKKVKHEKSRKAKKCLGPESLFVRSESLISRFSLKAVAASASFIVVFLSAILALLFRRDLGLDFVW